MSPDLFMKVKAALDERIAGTAPINIAFGIAFFEELERRNFISAGSFYNPAFPLGVGSKYLPLPAYLGVHPAVSTSTLPPEGFLVGAGGQDA